MEGSSFLDDAFLEYDVRAQSWIGSLDGGACGRKLFTVVQRKVLENFRQQGMEISINVSLCPHNLQL